MKGDLIVSDDESVYLFDVRPNGQGYIRAGLVVCVNTARSVATFTSSDETLQLVFPEACLDSSHIVKTYNLDLRILSRK